MKKLYLECNSGISGDMTVAALLDLGADETVLRKAVESIPDQGFKIEISRVKKSGIDCMDFSVKLDSEHENHDHDMEYLHGHEHHCHLEHAEGHEHHHHPENEEGHEHHHHSEDEKGHHHHSGEESPHDHHHTHSHRGMPEIRKILEGISMTDSAREKALRIFEILAQAEAKVHGCEIDKVHFHEVGAIDSIVDIVAAAVCMDNLGIEEVIIPKLCEGCGTIRCQHGILPIPVPATAQIMAEYRLPVEFMDIRGEFVTPTGAAIAAAFMTSPHLPEKFHIVKIGMGAGKREYERPGILRGMLIEAY